MLKSRLQHSRSGPIFEVKIAIISRPGLGVEFALLKIKIDFNRPFLMIFYHTVVNDSILEIDSNSSNYSIPVNFAGKPEENLFLYHQSRRSHCLSQR